MPYQVSTMVWVGSGEDFCGLGWVGLGPEILGWVGLSFEKVTHDQLWDSGNRKNVEKSVALRSIALCEWF